MKIKFQLTDWSILFTVASTSFYIIFRNLGREVGSFAFLYAPLTLLLIFFSYPKTYTKGPIRILLIYGAIIVGIMQYTLWKYMGDWNRVRISLEFYYIVVMTAILTYYLAKGEFIKLALISKWVFIFIIITLITTNVALFFDPSIVRESAATGEFSPSQNKLYNFSGAMSYSYVQAIICLIPILIFHIKNKQKMVFSYKALTAILILILITQLRSQVFANILVAGLITILSFIGTKNRRAIIITLALAGILFVAIPNSFYAESIYGLSSYFTPNSLLDKKIRGFASFIENPEFDNSSPIAGRAARYPLLFKALAAKPVTGNASYDNRINIRGGAHLYWMNRAAIWGIPAFIFFIIVLYKLFSNINSLFDNDYRFNYLLSVMALVFLGLLKAIGGREPWLILILVIPGLYFLQISEQGISHKMDGKESY